MQPLVPPNAEDLSKLRTQHDVVRMRAESHVDIEQAFLLYAMFSGDSERTAAALSVPAKWIDYLVVSEGWLEKLKPILALKAENKPVEIERAMNRAVNFVQAHRIRIFLERTLREMSAWTDEELRKNLVQVHFKGKGETSRVENVLTTRPFADLASAMEKAHAMTYMALGDTASDRSKRKETGDDAGEHVGDLHVQIAKAMARVADTKGVVSELVEGVVAQSEYAAEVLKDAVTKV